MKKKTLHDLGEFGLIDLIMKGKLPQFSNCVKGIGDDTAVLKGTKTHHQLLSIDTIIEGIDFTKSTSTPEGVGYKAVAVNLSDIAAMGGRPTAIVMSLTVPAHTQIQYIKRFYEGAKRASKRFKVSFVGGDLSGGKTLSCTVAVTGEVHKKQVVYRVGSQVGDLIGVTGPLGGSILGKHLSFTPRLLEGQTLARYGVSSMIDISDGLLQDLHHLMTKKNIAFEIDETKIPISNAAKRLAKKSKRSALDHALTDGEDFELLFTVPSKHFIKLNRLWKQKFKKSLVVIGRVIPRSLARASKRKKLGYQHF